jgi:hypothetical protein
MQITEEANRFGFEWREDDAGAAPLQVTRLTSLGSGRRVVGILTPRQEAEVYVTRSGLIRVWLNGRELR